MICATPRTARPLTALLTMVSGEHDHLLSQVDGLSLSTWLPGIHVVTSVRDRTLTRGRLPIRSDRWTTVVPVLPVPPSRNAFLPALHTAGQVALDAGADVLIFLSVHAIPSRRLIQVFAEAATDDQASTPTLWHSAVDGLAPAPESGYPVAGDLEALLLDARPPDDAPSAGSGPRWCNSFAMTAADWRAVLPEVLGAHPDDATPGDVEDVIAARSGQLRRVTGATAYLQHTPLEELSLPARPDS